MAVERTSEMRLAASIMWAITAVISFLYFLLLSPHMPYISRDHFESGWFLAGMAVAFLWLPFLLRRAWKPKLSESLDLQLSLISILAIAVFFGGLWHEATVVR
jgi:hypothetical protein